MQLSPGDTIQILLTTGGTTYAKTSKIDEALTLHGLMGLSANMAYYLFEDIDLYADEPAPFED